MFTGIVREIGRVEAVDGGVDGVSLVIDAPVTAPGVEVGGSVVDRRRLSDGGVASDGDRLAFHAVPETLHRSSLARLAPGSRVNLEPALRAGEPLGGHYVQGHIDGIGTVRSVEPEGEGLASSSPRRRSSCATASRRARSPSRGSPSRLPRSTTTASPWR